MSSYLEIAAWLIEKEGWAPCSPEHKDYKGGYCMQVAFAVAMGFSPKDWSNEEVYWHPEFVKLGDLCEEKYGNFSVWATNDLDLKSGEEAIALLREADAR